MNVSESIANIAKRELGFTLVGIQPAEPTTTFAQYANWVDSGLHADMEWIHSEGRREKRQDVRNVMPSAKTVITLAYSYYTQDLPEEVLNDPSRGIFARYTWGRDYHKVLKPKLIQLAEHIQTTLGVPVDYRAYVDTGPLLERALAVRAGLGFVGKNSMLINQAYGSYLFLSELLLDVELEPFVERGARGIKNPTEAGSGCRACTKCVDVCPTKAIISPGVIDANKCLAYHSIENRGSIPEWIRPLMKNRVYGCDICQEVCPWNGTAKSKSSKSDWLQADLQHQAPPLIELARLDEPAFLERYKGTPIMRVKRRGLLRNVAIGLANWMQVEPNTDAYQALELLTQDHEPLVQKHAKWGIEQL